MPCYVGLDASKKTTAICVLDAGGAILREAVVPTTVADIVGALRGDGVRYGRVGLEACGLASWLYEGLARARLPVTCIEARHAHSVLQAQANKTDRSDARGIADLMRTGTYRTVHVKCARSRELQALVSARKLLKEKVVDVENAIRGLTLSLGLKVQSRRKATFELRVREIVRGHAFAESLMIPLLEARAALLATAAGLEGRLREEAEADPVCRLLTTAPGVGWLTALLFRVAIDEPGRFQSSRSVGAHLGLVPRTYQSGGSERRGGISRRGSSEMRTALFMSALALMKVRRPCSLKTWGDGVAARRGRKRALVAVARRLSVVLHRMWISGTPFPWEAAA